jgi:pilus assembly protein Flp/PilA
VNTLKTFFIDLRDDEDGASFLEYTVLLGIILAVTITTIVAVGGWAGDVWAQLCSGLEGAIAGVGIDCGVGGGGEGEGGG